jgi:uncharacterized protein
MAFQMTTSRSFISSENFSIFDDDRHSNKEQRFLGIGCNIDMRHIFLGFTLRDIGGRRFIRVITARYMHIQEIDSYAQKNSTFEN